MVTEKKRTEGGDKEDVEEVGGEIFEPGPWIHGVLLSVLARFDLFNLGYLSILERAVGGQERHGAGLQKEGMRKV